MKFSYENEDLFSEVIQDLAEFGADLKVITYKLSVSGSTGHRVYK